MDKNNTDDKDTVFHYCSADAFISIIRSGKIRLSRSDFMNDSHECGLWNQALKDFFPAKFQKGDASLYCFSRAGFFEEAAFGEWTKPFIACFSHCHDRLSQWRGYGDDGRGFAIGYRKLSIKNFIKAIENEYYSKKINSYHFLNIYSDNINYKKQPVLLDDVKKELDDLYEKSTCAYDFLRGITPRQAFSKNDSFSEEEEYRIVLRTNLINQEYEKYHPEELSVLSFRSSFTGAIIPYYDLTMPPPSRIVIGPKNPLTVEQLNFMLPRICEWGKHESYYFDCEKSHLTYK